MSMDDNDGQMIFGDLGAYSFPTFVLQVRKNPEKTSPRKLVPTGDRTRARCVTGMHATAWPTAVDLRTRHLKSMKIVVKKVHSYLCDTLLYMPLLLEFYYLHVTNNDFPFKILRIT